MPFPLGNVVDMSMNLSGYYVMVCRFTGSQIFLFFKVQVSVTIETSMYDHLTFQTGNE